MNSAPGDESDGAAAGSAIAEALQTVGRPLARLEELLEARLSGQREPRAEPAEDVPPETMTAVAVPAPVRGAIATGEMRLIEIVTGRAPGGGGLAPQL